MILIHFLCLVKLQTPTKKIVVLLSDEVNNTNNVSFQLCQPKDIIAGGCLAAHYINNSQNSLLGHFQLHPLLVPPSDPVKGVPKLLEILLDQAVEVIGVTGVVSDRTENFYSPLITHLDERVPQTYLNEYLPSLEDTANAIIKILQQLNWTKVTVIQSIYYTYAKVANHIRAAANSNFDFIAINEYTIASTIQKLKFGETKIFVMLAPPHISSSVIHKAIEKGVVWPHYVWVVVLLEPAYLTPSPMWENVLLIRYTTLKYSNTASAENVSCTNNFYSSLLCDAVWQVLMSNKSLLNSSIEDSTKFSNMNEHRDKSDCFLSNGNNVKETRVLLVLSIVRNQKIVVLRYYGITDSSTELVNVVEDIPTDQLPSRSSVDRLLLVGLCIMIFIAYVLAFVNISLMVIFRKEKEVKASSFTLTIVIYIGSCLLIFSATLQVLLLILAVQNWNFVCITIFCSFTTGLVILLLTYVLKTLRVWRIFSHFGKLSAAWSDSRLLVVVLIGSAVMLILSIVRTYDVKNAIMDSFKNDIAPPYHEKKSICRYNGSLLRKFIVPVIQIGYSIILSILLLVFSLKTCNINRSNFIETKRTNILIMAYIIMYLLFQTLVSVRGSDPYLLDNVFNVAISVLCQLVIFPPTFFPMFYRFVVKKYGCSRLFHNDHL